MLTLLIICSILKILYVFHALLYPVKYLTRVMHLEIIQAEIPSFRSSFRICDDPIFKEFLLGVLFG